MSNELEELWEKTLSEVKQDLNVPAYNTWFKKTSPVMIHEDTLVISTPNSFAKEWLESRYAKMLKSIIYKVSQKNLDIRFTIESERDEQLKRVAEQQSEEVIKEQATMKSLNPKYTFESFVIGGGNRFAHAAALAVAETPSKAYNPLFIYGGVGLGKTHLLHAIGHYVHQHNTHLKVKYVSSEKFTNDFISSIRDKEDKIVGFQNRYRNNDVLLVDDIQFLENKEATQEEFFHTFNTLHESNKQIVITSDRPPKDIATLEDRLRSRFEWGLITDIQPPDLETRIAILSRKVIQEGLMVPDMVMEFIASKIQSNIRELEGALIRIVAFSSLTKAPIDLQLAQDVLKDLIPDNDIKQITIDDIKKDVCRYFSLSTEEIVSNKRSQVLVYPRQIAMYLARELTDFSLPKIGEEFGGRDHTTVMHACNKVRKMLTENRELYNQIQELTNRIKQGY